MAEAKPIYAALQAIQRDLKAPKSKTNSFGKYQYRSAEDILEAVKPHLNENGLILTLSDDICEVAGRVYVKATATLTDVTTGDSISNQAMAREPQMKKGMDDPQITGTCSSYARKYCLNGLFAIDDTKDADTDEYRTETVNKAKAADAEQADLSNAIHNLNGAIKKSGIPTEELKNIVSNVYGKTSIKQMTAKEVQELTLSLLDEAKANGK